MIPNQQEVSREYFDLAFNNITRVIDKIEVKLEKNSDQLSETMRFLEGQQRVQDVLIEQIKTHVEESSPIRNQVVLNTEFRTRTKAMFLLVWVAIIAVFTKRFSAA